MRPLRLHARGRGAALRVSLGDESCGAAALLHRLLGAPADDDCALQGALLDLAGRVGGSAAFTLLQDCEEPPCARCSARVAAFAASRPDVAVFAVADADDAPPNLWRLERARDAAALAARRDALAGCAGGCAGVQIAHAFQGIRCSASPRRRRCRVRRPAAAVCSPRTTRSCAAGCRATSSPTSSSTAPTRSCAPRASGCRRRRSTASCRLRGCARRARRMAAAAAACSSSSRRCASCAPRRAGTSAVPPPPLGTTPSMRTAAPLSFRRRRLATWRR